METYLETTKEVYKKAAEQPDVGLCCTTTPVWQLPGLGIPPIMLEMNYGALRWSWWWNGTAAVCLFQ